jgi:hypothetical protein
MRKLHTTTSKSKPPIIVSNSNPEPDYQQLEQEWLERQMYSQDDRGYYV